MADPGDINLKLLSESTDGKPIKVAATTAGSPTAVHKHPGGTDTMDLVYLWVCNTDSASRTVTVVVYASGDTPTDVDNAVWKGDVPATSGMWVPLNGQPITNAKWIGVYASATNVVTASGKVGRATL